MRFVLWVVLFAPLACVTAEHARLRPEGHCLGTDLVGRHHPSRTYYLDGAPIDDGLFREAARSYAPSVALLEANDRRRYLFNGTEGLVAISFFGSLGASLTQPCASSRSCSVISMGSAALSWGLFWLAALLAPERGAEQKIVDAFNQSSGCAAVRER
jgi:hypothetical protein